MIENLDDFKKLDRNDFVNLNPLSLAFVGDSVWTVLVRTELTANSTYKNTNLHKFSVRFVRASYQAKMLDELTFDEEESDVIRRARNAKLNTVPKNADLMEYKKSTSFEAVVGYNYLKKNFGRVNELFEKCREDIKLLLKEVCK